MRNLAVLTFAIFAFVGMISPISTAVAQTCVQPQSGLVSWWRGDGDANDSQGSSDGTLIGATFTTGFVTSGTGEAFNFDGDDWVEIPDTANLRLQQYTLAAWVTSNPGNQTGCIICKQWGAAFLDSYALYLRNGDQVSSFSETDNGTLDIRGPGSVPMGGSFHHVATTWNGTELITYLDGALSASISPFDASTVLYDDAPVLLGADDEGTNNVSIFYDGIIDEAQIFDRTLSQAEIQAIVDAGSAGTCTTLSIGVDIKPGSDLNSVNPCSNGAVPVAILGSDTFDVFDIDTETLRFAEASVKMVGKKDPHSLCSMQDVNDDWIDDLVCHYVTTDFASLDGEATSATVNGQLFDGTVIEGTDSVNIVKDTCN